MNAIFYFLAAIAIVLILTGLFLYYRAEGREIESVPMKRSLPGKFFIIILITCSILGMAITEWQGDCRFSPYGFIIGILLGVSVECIVWFRKPGKICK